MNKVVLYGTVNRTSGAYSTNPYMPNMNMQNMNMYGNPNSLKNSFDQIFRQLQGR